MKRFIMSFSAVDLFCGAGGLSHGLLQEGIPVRAGIDVDPDCRYPFEKNNESRFIQKSVQKLSTAEVAELYPNGDIKILVGCAPCQPFSSYTQGQSNKGDTKWGLLYSFAAIVEEMMPEIVSMENVPQLITHDVYKDFVDKLKTFGYHVSAKPVYCPQYGIPQTRKRLILLASRLGPIDIIPPTHKKEEYSKVKDVISGLEPIGAGEVSKNDPLHRSSRLSEINLKRIRASRPGGTWRDWSDDLIAKCHKKKSGKTYPGVYGRMEWDKPAPTMTTQCYGFGNGRFGHPEQDRAISLREAAILQTFPADYKFLEPGKPVYVKNLGRLIGNAVPVNLGRVIAKSILQHLAEHENLTTKKTA